MVMTSKFDAVPLCKGMAELPFQKQRYRNSNAENAQLNISWQKTFNLVFKFTQN
jgi:hypothetical protein